jgi:hypothetical protein
VCAPSCVIPLVLLHGSSWLSVENQSIVCCLDPHCRYRKRWNPDCLEFRACWKYGPVGCVCEHLQKSVCSRPLDLDSQIRPRIGTPFGQSSIAESPVGLRSSLPGVSRSAPVLIRDWQSRPTSMSNCPRDNNGAIYGLIRCREGIRGRNFHDDGADRPVITNGEGSEHRD